MPGPSAEFYNEERKKSDALPHRKSNLEDLALSIQTGPLRNEVWAIIDAELSCLPSIEEQKEEDKLWRLALHRMDLRNWEVKRELDDGSFLVQPSSPEADLQEIVDDNIEIQALHQEISRLLMWGVKVFRRETTEGISTDVWRERLNDAIKLAGREGTLDDVAAENILRGGISHVASVCVRDYWDELDDSQKEWCIDRLIVAVNRDADSDDYLCKVAENHKDEARPAAGTLSLICCKDLGTRVGELAEKTLFMALTHVNYEVRRYAADGIGLFLWEKNPDLAMKCASLCICRARLKIDYHASNQQKPFPERVPYEEVCRASNLEARRIASIDSAVNSEDFTSLNLDSSGLQDELWLLLNIFGNDKAGVLGVMFMTSLCRWLVSNWYRRETERGREHTHVNHQLESMCTRRLALFCLTLNPDDALKVCVDLIEKTEVLPEKAGDFIETLVADEDYRRSGETFWSLWQAFADKADSADWVQHLKDRYSYGEKLVYALFLSIPWKSGILHWEPLEGNSQRLDTLFDGFPLSGVTLDAYVRYLYHVGDRSLPGAFSRIARKLSEEDGVQTLKYSSVSFYIDSLLMRFVYGKPIAIKSDGQLREDVLALLDMLVDSGSSSAYLMRDDFVTPLSC